MSSEVRSHEIFFESDSASRDVAESIEELNKARESALAKGGSATYNRLSNAILKNEINVTSSFDTFRGVTRSELNYGPGNESRWGTDANPSVQGPASCESIHERLTRIKLELADVMGDIQNLQSNTSSGALGEGVGSKDVWGYLQEEASELVAKAEGASGMAATLSNLPPPLPSAAPAPLPAASSSATNGGEAPGLLQLEQRVHVLEALLGCGPSSSLTVPSSGPSGGIVASPLVTMLAGVEKKLSLLDSAAVDALRKKIPAIKREMDVLLNTVPKSAEPAGQTTGLKLLEAAVIIESLYTKASSYDAVIDDIPHIVARLKTLQGLHQEQSGYSARLTSLESLLASVGAEVANNAEVLHAVSGEMAANLATFEGNVQQIERRLAVVTKK
jgi:hypothetical protein